MTIKRAHIYFALNSYYIHTTVTGRVAGAAPSGDLALQAWHGLALNEAFAISFLGSSPHLISHDTEKCQNTKCPKELSFSLGMCQMLHRWGTQIGPSLSLIVPDQLWPHISLSHRGGERKRGVSGMRLCRDKIWWKQCVSSPGFGAVARDVYVCLLYILWVLHI